MTAVIFFGGCHLSGPTHPPPTHTNHGVSLLLRETQIGGRPSFAPGSVCNEYLLNLEERQLTLQPLESGDPQWGRISYPPALRLLIFPLAPERGENGLSSMTARICSNYAQRSKHLAETKTLQKWNCSYFMKWHHFAN